MTTAGIIIALIVYFIIPLAGLLLFLRLKNRMKNEHIQNAPITELFIIFATYGGLLLILLTSLIWPLDWSGMASLGCFYLILGAPIIMGIIAYRHRQSKNISRYHNWIFLSGLLYFITAPVTFMTLLFMSNKN